jgi:hypothetical protein
MNAPGPHCVSSDNGESSAVLVDHVNDDGTVEMYDANGGDDD